MARPAIVAKIALEARLLDARLLMNRSHRPRWILGNLPQACVIRLRAAQNGIDQGRARRTKIEGCQRSAIRRFYQRLIFSGSKEQFLVAIAIVVERFHAGSEASGSLLVGDELGADETAPKLGTRSEEHTSE